MYLRLSKCEAPSADGRPGTPGTCGLARELTRSLVSAGAANAESDAELARVAMKKEELDESLMIASDRWILKYVIRGEGNG